MNLLGHDDAGTDLHVCVHSKSNDLVMLHSLRAWDVDRVMQRLRDTYRYCIVERITAEQKWQLEHMIHERAVQISEIINGR